MEENSLPDRPRQTFISYSRVNQQFAIKLACELKSAGFDVWMDQFDIPTGARWDDEIEKALRECEIFLFIITPASIASENAKDEMGYAIDHGKHILPVLLEKCEVPLRLRRMQYVDFTQMSFEEGINHAKELLADLVGDRVSTTSGTSNPPGPQKTSLAGIREPKTAPTRRGAVLYKTQTKSTAPGRLLLKGIAVGSGLLLIGALIAAALIFRPLPSTTPPLLSPASVATPTVIPSEAAEPANSLVVPTAIDLRSFEEGFDSQDRWTTDWGLLLRHGDPKKREKIAYRVADSELTVDLSYQYIWGYFLYDPSVTFNNVEMEVTAAGLRSVDTIGLICHFGDQGWYEFDINGGGTYAIRFVDSMESNHDELRYVIKSGAIPGFNYSTERISENNIRANCDGRYLSLSVNGTEVIKDYKSRLALEQGRIGLSARSYENYPVQVVVRSLTVREPQKLPSPDQD